MLFLYACVNIKEINMILLTCSDTSENKKKYTSTSNHYVHELEVYVFYNHFVQQHSILTMIRKITQTQLNTHNSFTRPLFLHTFTHTLTDFGVFHLSLKCYLLYIVKYIETLYCIIEGVFYGIL